MKVKMRTLAAGPGGVLQAGQVYDLPAKMAQELVAGHYAEPVKTARETVAMQPPEAAVQPVAMQPPEAAVQPVAKTRRGKAK